MNDFTKGCAGSIHDSSSENKISVVNNDLGSFSELFFSRRNIIKSMLSKKGERSSKDIYVDDYKRNNTVIFSNQSKVNEIWLFIIEKNIYSKLYIIYWESNNIK